jgi:hypothetical protein
MAQDTITAMAHHRPKLPPVSIIQADESQQDRPRSTLCRMDKYETTTIPCSDCGAPIVWSAEQQKYWYEEVKAHIFATVNLRCQRCRKLGKHHINRNRAKQPRKN